MNGAELVAKKAQRQRAKVNVKVVVSAAEAVNLLATGAITIKGEPKRIKLKPQSTSAAAGQDATLGLRPAKKKDSRTVLAALAAGTKVVAKVSVVFTDASGNEELLRASIRLR